MTGDAAARPDALPALLAGYHPKVGVADELFDAAGRVRPVWQPFIDHLAALTPAQVDERFQRGTSYLREAGVYFRHYASDPGPEREWPLSPVPVLIHESEWRDICAGLAQRADLLERVMADLYGPGDLVRDGHLPAGLIAADAQWLRPLVGMQPASGHYLHFVSFEISRNPDGSWFVLGDRTQAPSGAGFALENRMATARIYNELRQRGRVHRLAGFFRAFRDALEGQAGRRSAMLTPGPGNASYFEHTYIARYLGLLLLEGEDMLVQDGAVMVRTVEGLEPLGAIWRRIDSEFADPLELREDSHLGVPGLVNALRQGNVTMVNALGAGVLEMRALMAFLPKINEVLTGAPLQLPNIATWWCGQPAERAYVMENRDRMILGGALDHDLPFDIGAMDPPGAAPRDPDPDAVARWLDAEGARIVGQEVVTLSTAPAWQGDRLVPRPMTVRVTAARTAGGWEFMPGGYARIGLADDATALAMQRGGSVADVWVVGEAPVPRLTMLDTTGGRRPGTEALPSRAADNLFWLGRYTERAETAVRLVRAYHLRLAETGEPEDPRLIQLAAYMAGWAIAPTAAPLPPELSAHMAAASTCAGKVRDRFSTDGWAALKDLSKTLRQMEATVRPGDDCARAMGVLLRKITGFTGLVHENMYRSMGWRFLAFGRALERADGTAAALAEFAAADAAEGALDLLIELGDSAITHRRRYVGEAVRDSVVDLLALDPANPRSLVFQLNSMVALAERLPKAGPAGRPSQLARGLLPAQTLVSVATPDAVTAETLQDLRTRLAEASDLLSATCFR